MKKNRKIVLITTIILIILLMLIPIKGYCMDDLINGMSGASDITSTGNSITQGLNTVLSLVRYVGSGISIIVVLLLGIKYMIASVDEKAEIKKKAVPIVIGCVILFATTNIIVMIKDIVDTI